MVALAPARRRTLPFGRRLVLTVAIVASLPLVAFGLFVTSRVDASLAAASEERVRDALTAVDGILARRQQDLAETTAAYGSWSVTASLVADGDLEMLRVDILGFVEARGGADLAIAVVDGSVVAASDDADVQALAALTTLRGGVLATDRGLLQVAIAPIGEAGMTANGDRLVFADRLDSAFALEVRGLTGFDVAVIGEDGRAAVASDPASAAAVRERIVGNRDDRGVVTGDALIAGWTSPPGAAGAKIVVTDRDDAVQTLLAQLPAALLISLGIAALLAIIVSVLVGRDLNGRLANIHRSLLDMAAGRRPSAAATGGPDVERLAGAVEGLVAAMDRRERILREASLTVAGMHPELGEAPTASTVAMGAVRIFDAVSATVLAADGSKLADAVAEAAEARGSGRADHAGDPGDRPDDRIVEAPLEGGAGSHGWLQARIAPSRPWTPSDDALFGMYALLAGGALNDARVHDLTSDRLARLNRLNDLQREFLRSVSHNLQTPLTTISLVAEDLALEGSTSPEFRARQIHAIRVQADRLERLVQHLITISRLDAGRLDLERDVVAIPPLVRRLWTALDSDRPLEIVDGTGDLVPLGDRDAIEQVLWILLDNVLRHAPHGPVQVTTAGEQAEDGPRVRIEVRDQGPGVPEDERRHIFRRFWSGAASRTWGGTGIGLDIARGLARAMGGSLRFEPNRPTGAIFVLTLPAEMGGPGPV